MNLYITDRSGKQFWRTNVAAGYASGERNNLKRHLANIKAQKMGYEFVDATSARLVEECEISDDQLLAELGL